MKRPLEGARVVDLSRLAPGPYATRLLAELGADVIKVEPKDGGDYARWWPPLVGDPPTGYIFRELNHGKRSVALDLKDPDAQLALRGLIATADILVDGFRPGVMKRLGLDPEGLMGELPRLIYCAITGFGLTGPDADRAGHDIGYMARAGTLSMSGTKDAPITLGIQVGDFGATFVALSGILAALYQREQTGQGSVVDVSLMESAMSFGPINFAKIHAEEKHERGTELLDGSRPCYSVYETKDGKHLAVGALEPKFWSRFVEAVGLPEIESGGLDVGEAGAAVRAKLQARLREKTRDEWTTLFREVEACVEPVLSAEEAERDPQNLARRVSGEGFVRSPIRLSDWANLGQGDDAIRGIPALGEHTREVLSEAGLSAELIEKLI